jgi:hemerythrin-like domain-containing protein
VSNLNSRNLGIELLRIHSTITGALQIAIEHSRFIAEQGYVSSTMREGFTGYIRNFISALDAHHRIEGQMAFPSLRRRLPEAPYDLLLDQHRCLSSALEQLTAILEEAEILGESKLASNMHLLLTRINDFWQPHIRIEEEHFTGEKIEALIDPEEQIRLIQMLEENSRHNPNRDAPVPPSFLQGVPPIRTAFV